MAKGIFTSKVNPAYDDLPEIRYHFPKTYMNKVEATVGDWITYYEPRRQDANLSGRDGRQSYFATARVERIESDPRLYNHYYAFVSDYIEFDLPVPFKVDGNYFESGLMKLDGSTNKGAFGRSVRLIQEQEYELILKCGFQAPIFTERDHALDAEKIREIAGSYERPIVKRLVSRPFRDIVFSKSVRDVYDSTCAFTGLKLINGGGRCEIEAAHIRPVGDGHFGPDSVRNGIALSRTVHWLFDRGILSLTDDYEILVAKNYASPQVTNLINPGGRIIVPPDPSVRPHSSFLEYHRERIFLGSH
jgi:putative restriction endonuclease